MESVLGILFSEENVRMLVLLASGIAGYVLLKTGLERKIDGLDHKIDRVETSLNSKIDHVENSLLKAMDEKIAAANENLYTRLYTQLRTNDFRHVNETIGALTFVLEKNGFLKREDKEYIDGRMDK
jgi:hypothetical protein